MAIRLSLVLMLVVAAFGIAGPALAEHAHDLTTPGTTVQDIGSGQTSIADTDHGGHHRFHSNVHVGNAGMTINAQTPVTIGLSS